MYKLIARDYKDSDSRLVITKMRTCLLFVWTDKIKYILLLIIRTCLLLVRTNGLVDQCNTACNCSSEVFDPMCGDNGVIYFSSCHAGCLTGSTSSGVYCFIMSSMYSNLCVLHYHTLLCLLSCIVKHFHALPCTKNYCNSYPCNTLNYHALIILFYNAISSIVINFRALPIIKIIK